MEEFKKASCIRGFYVYQDNWTPILGERLVCKNEPDNPRDRYAVEVYKAGDEIRSGASSQKYSSHVFGPRGQQPSKITHKISKSLRFQVRFHVRFQDYNKISRFHARFQDYNKISRL